MIQRSDVYRGAKFVNEQGAVCKIFRAETNEYGKSYVTFSLDGDYDCKSIGWLLQVLNENGYKEIDSCDESMQNNKFNSRFTEIAPKDRIGSELTYDVENSPIKLSKNLTSNFVKKELTKIIQSIKENAYVKIFDNEIKFNIDTTYGACTRIFVWGPDFANNLIKERTKRFLADCGLDITGEPVTGINDDNLGYGFNLYDNDEAAKCIKFFHNLWKKLPLAMNSYNTTKDMDDEAYNVYKGNLPSNKVLNWDFNCYGKDFSYTFKILDDGNTLSIQDNQDKHSEEDALHVQFPIEPYKLVGLLLKNRFINLENLINDADRETLNAVRRMYDIDDDDDEQNVGSYFVRDIIEAAYDIDTPIDENYKIYTIEGVKDVCEFIVKDLGDLISDNTITLKRDINDARAKKLKKHPDLRAKYESKKSLSSNGRNYQMNDSIFKSILNEAAEFEIGPDANGKTSVFTKKDVMTSHMTHNKAAVPTVEKKWVKVDKNAQPETWRTANAAYKKAKELGVADKIAAEANTRTADFEVDPITDDLEINFDNGGSINAGPLTESEVIFENASKKRAKLTEGFVVGEDNNELWFDQDAFSSFVADVLKINKEDVNGFKVCKEPWFDHDTCAYYTAILSKEDLEDYVNSHFDTSIFGPDFKILNISIDTNHIDTLLVRVCMSNEDFENKEFNDSRIGPFECSGFNLNRFDDNITIATLIFTPASDVTVDENYLER